MMSKTLLVLASAFMAGSSVAHAGSFIATGGVAVAGEGLVSGRPGVSEERFDGVGCTLTGATQVLGTRGIDYAIANDSLAARRLAPGGDTSCYFSVGAAQPEGSLALDLPDGAPLRYIGFYWGSPDAYNSVSFLNDSGQAVAISGYGTTVDGLEAVVRAGVPLYSDIFVEFRFFGGENVTAIFFETANYAFELDNLAFSTSFTPAIFADGDAVVTSGFSGGAAALAVPEAASWLAIVPGLALGAAARRRATVRSVR